MANNISYDSGQWYVDANSELIRERKNMLKIIDRQEVQIGSEFYAYGMLTVENRNPADTPLAETNYFRSDPAQKGFVKLLRKCSNYHLLIPPKGEDQIDEMLTGKFAQVVHGSHETRIVFDDLSNRPMTITFDNQQILEMFDELQDKPKRKGYLAIYRVDDQCPDDVIDKVIEVGRMDLWINRSFEKIPCTIRSLTCAEIAQYKGV